MTKKQALAEFKELYHRQDFIGIDGRLDKVARCEAWNQFTDELCKCNEITEAQYHNWTNPF